MEVNMLQFEVFFPDEMLDELDNNSSANNQQSNASFSAKQTHEVE